MNLLKLVTALVVAFALFGCASKKHQANIDDAQARIDSLSKYRLEHLAISPSNHKNFDSATAICGSTFATHRQDILESIDTSSTVKASSSLIKASREMAGLENWLNECANHFGIQIVALMKSPSDKDGLTTSEWLNRHHGAMMDHQIASNHLNRHRNEMRQLNNAIGMALMAGSSAPSAQYQYINPYIKNDGTYVEGHLRSTPNAFCYDNLNGC